VPVSPTGVMFSSSSPLGTSTYSTSIGGDNVSTSINVSVNSHPSGTSGPTISQVTDAVVGVGATVYSYSSEGFVKVTQVARSIWVFCMTGNPLCPENDG
jgi:hypothetical protein